MLAAGVWQLLTPTSVSKVLYNFSPILLLKSEVNNVLHEMPSKSIAPTTSQCVVDMPISLIYVSTINCRMEKLLLTLFSIWLLLQLPMLFHPPIKEVLLDSLSSVHSLLPASIPSKLEEIGSMEQNPQLPFPTSKPMEATTKKSTRFTKMHTTPRCIPSDLAMRATRSSLHEIEEETEVITILNKQIVNLLTLF